MAMPLATACGSDAPDAGAALDAGDTKDAGDASVADDASDARARGDASDGADASAEGDSSSIPYDTLVLNDGPVGFWDLDHSTGTEPDRTGHGHDGHYQGAKTATAALPNGDIASVFDGATQYVTIPSDAAFSIPTTGELTWEGWIRPDILQFPNASDDAYVEWMGKCADYAPSCEWEARMYSTITPEKRCNRLSAYVFNSSAGLGSGADWQPDCGLFQAGHWLYVVAAYTTKAQPSSCANASKYPGSVNIWVDGVEWDQASHGDTGCFSQYSVIPQAGDSPVNIGTMAKDAWFAGAIGKVAIYDKPLSQDAITSHYRAMTGLAPKGSCADTCTLQSP